MRGHLISTQVGVALSLLASLLVAPAVALEPQQITTDPADDGDPTYSPDGSQIAFSSSRSGNWDIWTTDVPTPVERMTWGAIKAQFR